MSEALAGRVVSIILNWNGYRQTSACLRSLERLDGVDHVPLVVDNGSTDDSLSRLRKEFPSLRIVETGANLGFAGGVNRGIAAALATRAEFLWLLNNDTTVAPDSLLQLVAALHERPDAGFAGSLIYYADRPDVIWCAGGAYSTPCGYVVHHDQDKPDCDRCDRVEEVEFACACSLLVRRSAAEDIGPMPEEFFLYWEDVAWNAMAAAAGWRILLVPRSRVWHEVGASLTSASGPPELLRIRYETRNRILFHRRHHPERLPRVAWRLITNSARKALSRSSRSIAMAQWGGFFDGLYGRTGPIAESHTLGAP